MARQVELVLPEERMQALLGLVVIQGQRYFSPTEFEGIHEGLLGALRAKSSGKKSAPRQAQNKEAHCACAELVLGKWRADPKCKLCEGSGLPPGAGLRRHLSRKKKVMGRAEKHDARATIREKVFARATVDGTPRCEGPEDSNPIGGALDGRCANPATDLQHIFGRGKGRLPESERTCLASCRRCHDAEGANDPDGAAWWAFFADRLRTLGFASEAHVALRRAHFEATRAALPAAPRVR